MIVIANNPLKPILKFDRDDVSKDSSYMHRAVSYNKNIIKKSALLIPKRTFNIKYKSVLKKNTSQSINSRVHRSFLYSKKNILENLKDLKIENNDKPKIKITLADNIKEENKKQNNSNFLSIDGRSKKDTLIINVIKESGSSIDYTSNDESTPPQHNIIKKIEINPYHNLTTVEKFFIYKLKKYYVEKKKEQGHDFKEQNINEKNNNNNKNNNNSNIKNKINEIINNQNNNNQNQNNENNNNENENNNPIINLINPSFHYVFSRYTLSISKKEEKILKLEDGNMQINQYLIFKNKLLGRGEYSDVYLCENTLTKNYYAIKIQTKKDIEKEISILKRLHSKYIVAIYEIIQSENESYIILELMKNSSLNNILNDIDLFCIWKYFRNLVSAIEHCHEIAKIIHRDITLNNCLIDDNDILKLSHFSNSIILNENSDIIHLGDIIEDKRILYSPPEAALRQGEIDIDGKALDFWLMGNCLFKMLFGESFIPPKQNNLNISNFDTSFIDIDDKDLKDLVCGLLNPNPDLRYGIEDIKINKWITKNGEFPMPDISEEALENCYNITSEEMKKSNF